MSDLVVLKTFLFRHEAEIAKLNLEASGIFCVIFADDLGGVRPHLSFGSAIVLSVFDCDLEKSKNILAPITE